MTKLRMTAVAAGLCIVATGLAACTSSSGSTANGSTSSSGAPTGAVTAGNTAANVVKGGTFTLAMAADPGNLDPQASAASNLYQFSFFAYDRLVNVASDGAIQSGLASTWQTKGTTTVLQLHKSITCSDGSSFTAADAAANINWIADPKNKSPFLGVFLPVGAKATADASANSVTITVPKIAPFILQGLGGIPIVCSAGLKNRKLLASKTDGTGPYQLGEAVANDHYTFTKRQGYSWGPDGATTATAGLPDTIVVKVIQNETTAANLLLSGGLNAATVIGPDSQRLSAANLFSIGLPAVTGEMWFNQSKSHLTADPKLRMALTQAVDLAQLAKVITSGRGTPGTTFAAVPPVACPGNSIASALPTHDLSAAKSMLDQDGWKVGAGGIRVKGGKQLSLTFQYNTTLGSAGSAAAELAAKEWKDLGVKIGMKAQDETASVQTLFSTGAWDISWEPVNVSSPDQLVGFLSGPTVPNGQNFADINNATYTKLATKASTIVGTKGCPTWLSAESAIVRAADVIPFANLSQQTFAKNARFAMSGDILPTSIRMTS